MKKKLSLIFLFLLATVTTLFVVVSEGKKKRIINESDSPDKFERYTTLSKKDAASFFDKSSPSEVSNVETDKNLAFESQKSNISKLQSSLLVILKEIEKIENESASLALHLLEPESHEISNSKKARTETLMGNGFNTKESILISLSQLETKRLENLVRQFNLEYQIMIQDREVLSEEYPLRSPNFKRRYEIFQLYKSSNLSK